MNYSKLFLRPIYRSSVIDRAVYGHRLRHGPIGVAISDPLGVVARGLETIKVKKHDPQAAVERIVELVKTYEVGTVIGLPRRTDNKVGESETKARELAVALEARVEIPVIMQDELFYISYC